MRGVHGREPGHQIDVIDVQLLKHIGGWRKGSDPNAAPVSSMFFFTAFRMSLRIAGSLLVPTRQADRHRTAIGRHDPLQPALYS